jgi:transposase
LTVKNRSEGATALVGIAAMSVVAQCVVDGEWRLEVETTADVVGCGGCGCRAVGHGRRRVKVRDLPISGRPVVLVWAKRLWRCVDADCDRRTWSETHPQIAPRAALTARARAEICRRVGEDEDSVAEVARAFGIGWHTAMAAVIEHGTPLVEDPARLDGVAAVGLDETTFLHANARRHTEYVTGFVDLDRARLLDVAPGRSGAVVDSWLAERPPEWLAQIGVVALDPFRGYANGVANHLGHATVVIDHFHAIRLAHRALDDVRRRVQQDTLGHRGRKGDPLYRIRRLLLRGGGRLGQRGFDRLMAGLAAGDPDGEVADAFVAKERLRDFYAARDPRIARRRLNDFYIHCAHSEIPELERLARTVSAWQHEILAYHTTGRASNGPTEAVNLLIEKIRRVGHGFRNMKNYRLRLLLRCGGIAWQTHRTARIRSHQPRLIA